ncbi:MAG: phenylalanine--tRNA ligase subunit alpha [Solirubrobacterales bacterium]|nr:phenylalanine--tRNA ligase subunit alpha [Solirubrobacterales bacterium]
MIDSITKLRAEAEAEIAAATSSAGLEEIRVRYLGRKAQLPNLLRGVRDLPADQRGEVGKVANESRVALEALIDSRCAQLDAAELDSRLVAGGLDVTLPGDPNHSPGRLHLITQTQRELEDVFIGLGFAIAEGPEIELVQYNFDALNHAAAHPARLWTDTFYVAGADDVSNPASLVLRTHTSPVQIRAMQAQAPPIYVIVPGRVYRRDSDATHTPQFHQLEGLAVDEGITLADLKGTLLAFARATFGDEREVRLRPHFFPFTEPSVEVDVSCFNCSDGVMAGGQRCNLCKGSTWIEILGAGMVDPNVFGHVSEHGYDPERVSGFAFGLGIERIAMLKHRVPDLRLFYENDVRFLRQFG